MHPSNRTVQYCAFIQTIYLLTIHGRSSNRTGRYCAFISTIYLLTMHGRSSDKTGRYCAFILTICLITIRGRSSNRTGFTFLWYVVELQTQRNDSMYSYWQFTSLELQTKWNDTVHSYWQCIPLIYVVELQTERNETMLCMHTDNLFPYVCGKTSNRTELCCAFIPTIYLLRTAIRTERYCAFIPTIYFFVICDKWNELPDEFRKQSSLNQFKILIGSWSGSSCQCFACKTS